MFITACSEQGVTAEDIGNRLKNLKLFGEAPGMDGDKEKEFSDAIMGAMQSLRENLSESFPAAVRKCLRICCVRLFVIELSFIQQFLPIDYCL